MGVPPLNGMALHRGVIPYFGHVSWLFADYCRPANPASPH